MSITYEEALETLESMFSEPWNRDSLDVVLRYQKGHMENTVDMILRHGDRDPQILVDQIESGVDPQQSAAAVDEQLARQLAQASSSTSTSAGGGGTGGSTNRTSKGKPITLPDDFLRIPGYTPPVNSISDDEALARMLQDELFTEELRRNPDFAHLARGSSVRASTATAPNTNRPNPMAGLQRNFNEFANRFKQGGNTGANNNDTSNPSPNIMKKISEMGDNAKRQLQILAAQFNANNNRQQQQQQNQSSAAAQQSEFRGLLDDDDDNMELAARKDL